ncbi:MAG TPA: hypothetical protein VE360_06315, partial [Pyrinomonadaceae bacterium]|nr:hypothetical protein [Pyrinomonadaceae bacterium]
SAPVIYRALQLTALVGFPAIVAFACAVVGRPLTSALAWVGGAIIFGFLLPRYILNKMLRGRQLRLRWGLADALDLMVVSIERASA